ncbi:hypothetical protein SCHPADRAFT_989024 [Schizopora paradoxa]|uniref:Uncharacterized protein n=1 Tax=Schizopora paradoxa TaxID=27342 RepID=A0A0H2RJV2_9AGAM|nr:hypothetical protein SCHPADRAFT_989024 [Schizopora paradoxa]
MPHDQHNALVRSHTFSSTTHSTATSPDIVGPGRTLGLLLDWLGKGLDSFLNKRASQINLGPEAVARDIRRIRRHEETSLFIRYAAPYAHLTSAQDKKIRKLCKNLLKYTRSHVRSTQFRALDEITKLTMEDRMVREAFLHLNVGKLVPNYKEVELSIAISKTMRSIMYTETHELWTHFLFLLDHSFDHFITPKHFDSLKKSLSNPDSSFLAARYIAQVVDHQMVSLLGKKFSDLIVHYFDLTITDDSIWHPGCGGLRSICPIGTRALWKVPRKTWWEKRTNWDETRVAYGITFHKAWSTWSSFWQAPPKCSTDFVKFWPQTTQNRVFCRYDIRNLRNS